MPHGNKLTTLEDSVPQVVFTLGHYVVKTNDKWYKYDMQINPVTVI